MTPRRRLRLLRTVVALVVVVWIGYVVVSRASHGSPSRPSSEIQVVSSSPSPIAHRQPTDPFTQPAVARYLAAHPGMTASIHDLTAGKVWTYRPDRRDTTASIMKVDILESVLREDGVL